jgi:hypothetical protein
MDKGNVVYTCIEYYSSTERNEILLFAAKWMELGDIFLNEISRHRKPNTTCSLSSVEATKSRYAHRIVNSRV